MSRAVGRRAIAAALGVSLAVGCAAASSAGPYRGLQLYGSDVYVCREAPTAASPEALANRLRDSSQGRDSPTGRSVTIQEKGDVEVGGERVAVARVAAEGEAAFWLPYTALCSRGDR